MNAVIYLRTSSSGNKETRQNTDRQLNDLTAYAEQKKYNVLGIYEEHISGAKKREEREELNRCIEFAKDNKCIILFSELSRLQRNIWELNKIISYFVENEINVYFQKENLTLFGVNIAQKLENFSLYFVPMLNADGVEISYDLVGSNESNPMEFKISDQSPIGAALMGKKAGDKVEVTTPGGVIHLSVVEVSRTQV